MKPTGMWMVGLVALLPLACSASGETEGNPGGSFEAAGSASALVPRAGRSGGGGEAAIVGAAGAGGRSSSGGATGSTTSGSGNLAGGAVGTSGSAGSSGLGSSGSPGLGLGGTTGLGTGGTADCPIPILCSSGGGAAGGSSGNGGSAGSGGQAGKCENLLCFDIFDCAIYHADVFSQCGFTKCEGLICK